MGSSPKIEFALSINITVKKFKKFYFGYIDMAALWLYKVFFEDKEQIHLFSYLIDNS